MSTLHTEPFGDLSEDRDRDDIEPEPKLAIREGLPPSYRMRADAHYVEQLEAPSAEPMISALRVRAIAADARRMGPPVPALVESLKRHGVLQPLLVQRHNGAMRLIDGHKRLQAAITAGLQEVPCFVRDLDDADAAALAEEADITGRRMQTTAAREAPPSSALDIQDDLVRALAAIDSSTQLFSASTSGLPQAVGADLIRAEVWRAACLLQASQVVQQGAPPGTSCSARRLVSSVAERAESERRLRGHALHVEREIPESLLIGGDPGTLSTALSGLVLAAFAVVEGRPATRMALTASVDAARQIELAVSEVGTAVPAQWEARVFDATWTERPGGLPATVWMLAARTVAEAYGGRVSASAIPRGRVVKMIMPIAAA
jgi:signal transduction histidine kinase